VLQLEKLLEMVIVAHRHPHCYSSPPFLSGQVKRRSDGNQTSKYNGFHRPQVTQKQQNRPIEQRIASIKKSPTLLLRAGLKYQTTKNKWAKILINLFLRKSANP